MIFLIEYDRPKGSMVRFERFDDSKRNEADSARLNIELDLRARHVEHEVVLLEAATEEDLRKTHRRYFEDVTQIGKTIRDDAA